MPVNSDREYAEDLIIEANNRLHTYISPAFPDQHRASHIMQDSQECIELYTKSMFKLIGIEFPESHQLNFGQNKVKSFIEKSYNEYDGFEYLDRLPRVILLTDFWHTFYNAGKYGDQNLNIRPQDIIEEEDIELVLGHAQYCGETAVALFEYTTDDSVEDVPRENNE